MSDGMCCGYGRRRPHGLTPPWHLLDTYTPPRQDITTTVSHGYPQAWHLDTSNQEIHEAFPSLSCPYHTENRGVSRKVTILFLYHELENYRINFTRRIAEYHGRQKFENSIIRDKKRKKKIRDCPRYSVWRQKFDNSIIRDKKKIRVKTKIRKNGNWKFGGMKEI